MRKMIVALLAAIALGPAAGQDQTDEAPESARRLVPVDPPFEASDAATQAQADATLEDLERDRFLLDGTLWERIEKDAQEKSIQCMKAFPHPEFCSCLSNELPMVLTVAQYSFIVSSSREELRYDQLSEEEKKMVDVTREAREQCVQETL